MIGFPAILNVLLVVAVIFTTCHAGLMSQESKGRGLQQDAADQPFVRLNKAGLPNAIQVQPSLISGGQPLSTNGFRSLAELGIKTIVSVDGICPDLKSAELFGIRYIHQPLGYRGISAEDAGTLAHIILKFDGPIYIHCHHGKHRSPAAAAVACVTAGLMTDKSAFKLLTTAGTGAEYKGLFQAVADATPIEANEILQLKPALPKQADVTKLVTVMVELDEDMRQLKSLLSEVSKPADTSLTVQQAQRSNLLERAAVLNDNFTELLRSHQQYESKSEFRKSLLMSQQASEKLQQFLEANLGPTLNPEHAVQASFLSKLISEQCNECHAAFRH